MIPAAYSQELFVLIMCFYIWIGFRRNFYDLIWRKMAIKLNYSRQKLSVDKNVKGHTSIAGDYWGRKQLQPPPPPLFLQGRIQKEKMTVDNLKF